jgi:transglutaminase-like putative cysteine protease/peroxiredoxin
LRRGPKLKEMKAILLLFFVGTLKPEHIDFQLQYTCIVTNIPKEARKVQIWIPYPRSDPFQKILSVKVHAHYPTYILEDAEYGNSFVYLEIDTPKYDYVDISMEILARRFERITYVKASDVEDPDSALLDSFSLYFKNNWDETADYNRLRRMAGQILKGKKTYFEKIRALYDYVYDHMEYSKEVPGYGKGDVERACRVMKGNCVDFHSFYVALANVSGIISREVAYIDIPLGKSNIPNYCHASYHCAVEVFLPGVNEWFPMDISHAKKGKGPKEFYFGSLDDLRLRLGHGRNIPLPRSNVRTKRLLHEPFVLIDGKKHDAVDVYVVANLYKDATKIYGNVIHPGDTARPFEAVDLDGETFSLKNYLGKKYILINFFTTWCGRCIWESEGLNRVYSEYRDKFIFVRINIMEEREKVEKFREEHRIPFPVIADEKTKISRLYGVNYVPANVIIGLDGKVKYVRGLLPERDLRELVKEVLDEG